MSEGTAAREENKCSLAAELLGCCGELRLRATGTSMLPALWPSDLITIRAEEFDRVAPGDIILYARGNRFFIHRVVKAPVDNGCRTLITRGDALAENDPPVCDHEPTKALIFNAFKRKFWPLDACRLRSPMVIGLCQGGVFHVQEALAIVLQILVDFVE